MHFWSHSPATLFPQSGRCFSLSHIVMARWHRCWWWCWYTPIYNNNNNNNEDYLYSAKEPSERHSWRFTYQLFLHTNTHTHARTHARMQHTHTHPHAISLHLPYIYIYLYISQTSTPCYCSMPCAHDRQWDKGVWHTTKTHCFCIQHGTQSCDHETRF